MELSIFIENLKAQLEEDYVSIDENTRFRELDEWSSLTSLAIIAMVDDEYGIVIKTDDINSVNTVGELFELVKSRA